MKIYLSFMAVVAVVALMLVVASTLPDAAFAHDIDCDNQSKHTDDIDTLIELGDVTSHSAPRFENGSMAADGELEIYVLEVTEVSQIRVGLRQLDWAADLRVYASELSGGNLVELKEFANTGTQDEWGSVYLRPGHYCFAVEDGSGGGTANRNSYVFRYSVHNSDRLDHFYASASAYDLGDLADNGFSNRLKRWASVNGKGLDYIDWYKFTLTGSGNSGLKLVAAALETDPTIKLYQENCTTEVTADSTVQASNGKRKTVTFDSIAADTTYCASVESQIGKAYDKYVLWVYRRDAF